MNVDELAAEIFKQVTAQRFADHNPESRAARFAPEVAAACFDWAEAFMNEKVNRTPGAGLGESLQNARVE
jgi:hypothetical protein